MWRAGIALQATVENIRDFVWEIYYWDLRTPNNAKPYFFLNEMNKKVLPAIYSAAIWSESGFRAVPVTIVALTKVSNFKCKLVARVTISTYATGARAEMTR